jgi:hypothetical protein
LHAYLTDTEYAAIKLFSLVWDEETRLARLQNTLDAASQERAYAQSIMFAGPPMTGFGEDTRPHFERKAREAGYRIGTLTADIAQLDAAIGAKAFSLRALAGAVLQIAKQGLVIGCGSLQACPPGRQVGPEVLKNVIWQGRNQAMHWEEGNYTAPVVACFQKLEQTFGGGFKLDVTPRQSLAQSILRLLGWSEYGAYVSDMQSLIG